MRGQSGTQQTIFTNLYTPFLLFLVCRMADAMFAGRGAGTEQGFHGLGPVAKQKNR